MDYEYQLILKSDWNTVGSGNTQWFYFSIANIRKNVDYRFNIINMTKQDSLYNSGMKPLMYSDKQAKYKSSLIETQRSAGIGQEPRYVTTRTTSSGRTGASTTL